DYKVTGVQTCALPIFYREHVEWLLLARNFGQRFPNISAGNRSLAASIQRLSEQFGSCRFAVRARDCDDRNFIAKAPTEFELADRSEERRVGKEGRGWW